MPGHAQGPDGDLIRLQGVSKTYRLGAVAVTGLVDVDLALRRERFSVVAGPSGSGKTTLLNLVGCIDRPDKGRIEVRGTDIAGLDDDRLSDFRARTIGYIFQGFNLVPVLSAFENVEQSLRIAGIAGKERRERTRAMLASVGLADKAAHKPDELSGGQRQRVAIARALVKEPALVLADEPTANLDSATGKQILDLMHDMQSRLKTSFVFSSHDPQLVERADDLVTIRDGRVVEVRRAA
ncbi:MAG: ABC transporter ATP-binding protein [Alphaproteobacteria bacterium]|nr:ABC transporter ATP-binding protein [Alphaproteobacteria bacterium]